MTTHAPGPADAFVSAPPIAPDGPRSPVPAARALMRAGLVGFALFAPFSIAGMSVTLGLVAAGAALDAVTRRDVALGALTGRRDPLVVAAALVVATAIPAVLLSENRDRAWHDARSMWQYAVPFVVAWAATRTGERRGVLHVLAGASMLAAVMALVQRAGGMDLGPLHIDAEHRVSGTLHPMTFAGIFAMLVPLSAALATAPGTTRRSRAFFAAAALLQWAALLLTLTRGAWLAAAAGLATLSALRRHRALVVGAALLGAATWAFASASGRDAGRSIAPSEVLRHPADRNVHTRLVLWRAAWTLFREHPIVGVGMGDFETEAREVIERRGARGVLTTTDAHNVALHVLATRGLLGFVPLAAFWAIVIASLGRARRRLPAASRRRALVDAGLAVTIVILVGSLTENNIDDEEVFDVFMVILGLARGAAGATR